MATINQLINKRSGVKEKDHDYHGRELCFIMQAKWMPKSIGNLVTHSLPRTLMLHE